MPTGTEDKRRTPTAPRAPKSSTWRMELVVAVLGMVLGLATALLLLS